MTATPPRNTKQRAAIRAVFERADRPLSVGEVQGRAADSARQVGVATVYRSIGALVLDGWLRPVEMPGQPIRYERSAKAHHHHFHCDSCEKVYDIDGCAAEIASLVPPRFRVTSHELILNGTCPDCEGVAV